MDLSTDAIRDLAEPDEVEESFALRAAREQAEHAAPPPGVDTPGRRASRRASLERELAQYRQNGDAGGVQAVRAELAHLDALPPPPEPKPAEAVVGVVQSGRGSPFGSEHAIRDGGLLGDPRPPQPPTDEQKARRRQALMAEMAGCQERGDVDGTAAVRAELENWR